MDKEIRALPVVELRVERDSDSPKITGYVVKFNEWSENLGGFREKVAPGAFKKSLRGGDIRSLFNHDPNYVLGRTKNGTLKLREDDTGLKYEATPPDTQQARDVMALIERGDVDGMSFMFRVVSDTWDKLDDSKNPAERTLNEVELVETGPVVFPAYPQSEASVRALGAMPAEARLAAEVQRARETAEAAARDRAMLADDLAVTEALGE